MIGLAAARRRVDGGEGKWQQKHIKTTRSNSTKPTAARLRSARIDVGLADEQHSATATGWKPQRPGGMMPPPYSFRVPCGKEGHLRKASLIISSLPWTPHPRLRRGYAGVGGQLTVLWPRKCLHQRQWSASTLAGRGPCSVHQTPSPQLSSPRGRRGRVMGLGPAQGRAARCV